MRQSMRIRLAGVAALWTLAGASLPAAPEGVAPPDRTALEAWIETKRLISREKQDWRVAETTLRDRIDLLKREVVTIRTKTQEARDDIGEADKQLQALEADNARLKAATGGLKKTATTLEQRVLQLLEWSPSPIRERIAVLSQRIPKDPANTKVGLSERFQNVIGILNEMNKYALDISEAVEVRQMDGEVQAEVTVLYLGLGQAYYSNLNGGVAGVGVPTRDGWEWDEHNDKVAELSDLISVFRTEKPAAYIPVPARVHDVTDTKEERHATE